MSGDRLLVSVHTTLLAEPVPAATRVAESPRRSGAILIGLWRIILSAAGIAALAWACVDPRFRSEEGLLTGRFCLPFVSGLSFVLVGASAASRWQWFGWWTGLALVGQAAALQLIEAGPFVRYQHYGEVTELSRQSVAFGLVVMQAVLVIVGLRRHFGALTSWLARHPGSWRALLIAAVLLPLGAAASRDVPRFLIELGVAAVVQLIGLANIVLAAVSVPAGGVQHLGERLRRLVPGKSDDTDGLLVAGAALWVTATAGVLSAFCYERHPHVPDEVVYLLHARYLAAGQLDLPLPSVPEAFDLDLMLYENDRWYCPVPPGWPAMLAVGVWLGVPWLVNPVLAGINVVLCYLLVRRAYDRDTARLVVLLFCLSPWQLFLAMSFMTHTFAVTCALAAALMLLHARDTDRSIWAVVAGAGVGVLALIRPLEGLIAAGLLGLWAVGVGGKRLRLALTASLVLGVVLVGSVTLLYNHALTGNPLKFPLTAYTDKYYAPGVNSLGFGPNIGLGWGLDPYPGHGLRDVAVNTQLNLFAINAELLGWATAGLLPIVLLIACGKLNRQDRLALGVVAAIIVTHAFYWFSGGPDFGARYWYLALVPCLVLAARGIQFVAQFLTGKLESTAADWAAPLAGARVALGVGVLCLAAWIAYVPWRAIDKYYHFRGMRPDVRELAATNDFGSSLVLIQGKRFPDYASAAVYNPLDLTAAEPVYAWDRNPEVRRRLLEAYSERPVWIVAGPSLTHAGYRIVRGPVEARALAVEAPDEEATR